MDIVGYFSSLSFQTLLQALPKTIAQGIVWGIMALGVFITYKMLKFADLSVDGTFATGGAVTVMMLINGHSIWIAMAAAFLAGLTAGLVTGILHTLFGIPDILAGILCQIALYSINLRIMKQSNRPISVDKYTLVISLRNLNITILTSLIFAVVIIALLYWYFGTEQGSAIRATGCNPKMAPAQGININIYKIIALSLSNGIVALSGSLLSQYQGFADISMGKGAIVIGLAAVIIGEVIGEAIFKKHFNFVMRLAFVVIGGIIYYIVIGIVLWLKMHSDYMKLFTAVIVAVFLAIPYLRGKSRNSFRRVAKMNRKNAESEVEENAGD